MDISQPFSDGRFSPDADQTWLSAFGHRRGVHGWWWPALAGVALALSPFGAVDALWGPIIGWGSHLFPADWFFGKALTSDYPATLGPAAYVLACLVSVGVFSAILLFRYRRIAA